MDLRAIGEFGLIAKIRRWVPVARPGVVRGIGDDAAAIVMGKKTLLITTDMLVEGVHFNRAWTDPYALGNKSLMVNLSDMAAMGGIPGYFLLSLGLPEDLPFSFVSAFYRGIRSGAKRFGVDLVGGDTSVSRKIVISVCLLGEGRTGEILYRNGAKAGNDLYVSGTVGDSSLGLELLRDRDSRDKPRGLIRKHLFPRPRIELGRALGRRRLATSMIDVSDGLLIDTAHLLEESGTGARIWQTSVPVSRLYRKYAPLYSKDPERFALCGGEDYELLFTAPPSAKTRIQSLAAFLQIPITRIGRIHPGKDGFYLVRKDGTEYPPDCLGFEHFGKKGPIRRPRPA